MEKEFEEFMKNNNKKNKELDLELKMLMDGDPEFKKMKAKKDPNEIDSDDCIIYKLIK